MLNNQRILILGCGYVGLRLAKRAAADGALVQATTRIAGRFPEIRDAGAEPVRADALDPDALKRLAEWNPDAVFDLVRPHQAEPGGYSAEPARNVAAAFAGRRLEALVYLSSTSVYGERTGEWTDEDSPANPSSAIGRARAEAEAIYLRAYRESGLPARICRAPRIYGPQRTLRERLETGAYLRVDDETQSVSRIHVDDAVEGLLATWRAGRDGAVYLLCDDEPVTGTEYAQLTAELLSLPVPPSVARDDIRDELARSDFERRISTPRCSNRRMREELGVKLRYPSVREGVPAALREEGAI